eukprot:jgi/Chlat1/7885/Chrsp66S07314
MINYTPSDSWRRGGGGGKKWGVESGAGSAGLEAEAKAKAEAKGIAGETPCHPSCIHAVLQRKPPLPVLVASSYEARGAAKEPAPKLQQKVKAGRKRPANALDDEGGQTQQTVAPTKNVRQVEASALQRHYTTTMVRVKDSQRLRKQGLWMNVFLTTSELCGG